MRLAMLALLAICSCGNDALTDAGVVIDGSVAADSNFHPDLSMEPILDFSTPRMDDMATPEDGVDASSADLSPCILTQVRMCVGLGGMCLAPGDCAKQTECYSGLCCGSIGRPCKADAECCHRNSPDYHCIGGVCICSGPQMPCKKLGDCCPRAYPVSCESGKCCLLKDDTCAVNADCCFGACDVQTLRCH